MQEITPRSHGRRELLRLALTVLLIFAAWRGSMLLFDFAGTNLAFGKRVLAPGDVREHPAGYFSQAWCQWDCAWYDRIAAHGYTAAAYGRSGMREEAFFPLFPFLARMLGDLIGSVRAAGLLVAHLGTLLGLWFVFLTALLFVSEEKARRALILLLLFPGSLFYSAFYSEGLFLCVTAGSAYYFFKKQWLLCGLFGMLAMLTRSSAVVLGAAMGASLLYDLLKRRARFTPGMLWLGLFPAGLGIFMLILHWSVGDALAFVSAQKAWGRELFFPVATVIRELRWVNPAFPREASNIHRIMDSAAAVGFLSVAAVMAVRRWHPVLWLYVMGAVLMSLSTGMVLSMVRFMAVLFPVFIYLADWAEDRRVERALIYAFTFFLAIYSVMFLNGKWAG